MLSLHELCPIITLRHCPHHTEYNNTSLDGSPLFSLRSMWSWKQLHRTDMSTAKRTLKTKHKKKYQHLKQGGWITVTTPPYYARVDFSDPSLLHSGCLIYRIDVLSVHAGQCDNFYFCVQFWWLSSRHEMTTIPPFSYNPNNVQWTA